MTDQKIFAILAVILLVSCGAPTSSEQVNEVPEQSCDSCDWRAMNVRQAQSVSSESLMINAPTVIEFFKLAEDVELRMSVAALHDYGMNWCYETMDQKGVYDTQILPLIRGKVTVIDTLEPDDLMKFVCEDKDYTIDLRLFATHDGVLMFVPGKEPIFWQESAMHAKCNWSKFIECYFGK